jgi:hypothetical protein
MELFVIDIRCCRSDQRMTLTVDPSRSCRMILASAAAAFGYRSMDEVGLMHLGTNEKLTDLNLSLDEANVRALDGLGIIASQ